jgi:hypothetical protein
VPNELEPESGTISTDHSPGTRDAADLEPRALGRSDYPTFLPLHEVLILARHCSGGVILGFEQFRAEAGTWKRWETKEKQVEKGTPVPFPTPWNHLGAGILFSLGLPLLCVS